MNITQYMQDPDNIWTIRVIGRKAGLSIFKELINDEKHPVKKSLLKDALSLEKKIIKAAINEDQVLFDALDAQSEAIFAQIKTA